MKKYLLLLLLFICFLSFGQNQEVISTTMINHTPGYTLGISIQNNRFTYSYNKPGAETPTTFTLTNNEEQAFINGFTSVAKADTLSLKLSPTGVKEEARRLFYYFKGVEALSDNLLTQPIAGTIDANNQSLIPVFLLQDERFLRLEAVDSIRTFKKLAKINPGNTIERDNLIHSRTVAIALIKVKIDSLTILNKSITRLQKSKPFDATLIKLVENQVQQENLKMRNSSYRNSDFLIRQKNRIDSIVGKITELSNRRVKWKSDSTELKPLELTQSRLKSQIQNLTNTVNNFDKRIARYQRTQPYLRLFEKRWFELNGQRYVRRDFKKSMINEISLLDDIKNDNIYLENRDSIERLLGQRRQIETLQNSSRKTISDTTKKLVERGKKISIDSTNFRHDLKTFLAKLKTNITVSKETFWSGVFFEGIDYAFLLRRRDTIDWKNEMVFLKSELDAAKKDKKKELNKQYEESKKVFDESKKKFIEMKGLLESNEYSSLIEKFKNLSELNNKRNKTSQDVIRKKGELDSLISNHTKVLRFLTSFKEALLKNISRSYNNKLYKQAIKIKSFQIEITEGFIENILVVGQIGNKFTYLNDALILRDTLVTEIGKGEIKLQNKHPFGFSRKIDFENLKNKYLYHIEENGPGFKLYLQNLFNAKTYVEKLVNYRRDYSPADTVLVYDENNRETHYILKKDPTYKLFEARVYSDFVGLDRTSPNGLIQTEISKRVSLITYRRTLGKIEGANFGWLGYIIPSLTLSKIEQANRDLLLNRIDTVGGRYAPIKYTSTLNLRQYENFRTGFDLNLAVLDIPRFKSTFQLDIGFRYGRVAIVDSAKANINGAIKKIGTNYGVNTFRFYPRIGWLIRTDERYSFYFEGGLNWYWLRDESFKQVANNDVFRSSQNAGGADTNKYINFLFEMALNTGATNKSNKGRLFFRYQYNYQYNYFNTGFQQAQVGYSFYLLKNK